MAPTKKSIKGFKKEKIFHPESRKAEQIARKQLRNSKLAGQASRRAKLHSVKADFYGSFFHAIPEEGDGLLTLPELHELVSNVWLTRHDSELEEERAMRRKGRPKSIKELRIEEIKLREAEEYRTGMEVPDLTHPENVALYRTWDQREVAFVQMLRFIRISSMKPEIAIPRKNERDVLMDVETDGAQ
ncbi:translation machinery-associated protein 16 [Multifurca ochricompacta]|uniref:Translation machinery-associated protein 16 n=1 Tax=Multifurca ochricompacta TaxID=376703 RepID=A0AAD4QJS3_9AGAM|nr:translation machinery-associated protein 16 [Multifurca ochricompacta]